MIPQKLMSARLAGDFAARRTWLAAPCASRHASQVFGEKSGRGRGNMGPTSAKWKGGLTVLGAVCTVVSAGNSSRSSPNYCDVNCSPSLPYQFLVKLSLAPYGVLGTRLGCDKCVTHSGSSPSPEDVVVDSGGHQVPPPGSPKRAGGAAKAIYQWAGIGDQAEFPKDVFDAVKSERDCKYHDYGRGRHVLHAFGPDLRKMPSTDFTWDEIVNLLADTYCNIFHEFVNSQRSVLRLLPVSGGIYAGEYHPRMAQLTMTAVRRGFEQLPHEKQRRLLSRQVELCIFMESEMSSFQQALGSVRGSS